VLVAASFTAAPSMASATGQRETGDTSTLGPNVMLKPSSQPLARPGAKAQRSHSPLTLTEKTCTKTSDTLLVCLAPRKPSPRAASLNLAPVAFPLWCAEGSGQVVAGTRTAACRITGLILTTERITNGTVTVTGVLNMDVYDFTYAAVDLPNWIHQIGIAPVATGSWGAALNSTVTGTLAASGDCTLNGASSFPVQSLAPANGTLRVGEAGAKTTATAVGAIGSCTTTWNLRLQPVNHPVATASTSMEEIGCDNAIGANLSRPARVGCVVPWYPAQVLYSQSRYPSLASHVSRAQGSGLPGATLANPLNRNVDEASINLNRSRACGDAPSITGRSCDEYPLASTYQGLAFGGTRRTFSGCDINAPTGVTGATGVSACMITDSENSAQGALMAAFYYENRVLNTDPYRVGIGS
jgi:hypothetical protein